jgi:basic amino acid/polyamine antiporter, APA family
MGRNLSAPRQLGWVSATALVVASMIGTGVFTTSGFLLADLGSPWRVLAVWLGGGIIAGLGALSYGALARQIPESGGEYVFLSRTLHPAAGYVAGWISLLVGFSAPLAAAALAFGQYAGAFFPGLPGLVAGTLLILFFSSLHAYDVRLGALWQNWGVLLKLVLITGFAGYGLTLISPSAAKVAAPEIPVSTFAVSLVWVSFSYAGWNAAIYIGGEVRRPERNLPLALLLGTGLVTLLYLSLNAVFVFSAPIEELAGKLEVGRIAAESLGGAGPARVVTAGILLALGTSVSSLIMAGPRVYAKMAGDGYLPRWFASSSGPPRGAIGLQCALALVLLWSAAYDWLLTYIGFTLGISTAATVLGLVLLRLREGSKVPVPGWPWAPALFLISVSGITLLTIWGRPWESLIGFLTIGLGLAAWFISGKSR